MKKKLLIIHTLFFLACLPIYASVNCSIHRVYCAIKHLKPSMDASFAMDLSNKIYFEAKKQKFDPIISVAIAMAESSLTVGKERKQKVIVEINGEYKIIKGVTDKSIFQFHAGTIESYNLDLNRIYLDLDYVIWVHFHIMKKKLKVCSSKKRIKGVPEWTCYHSYTVERRREYYRSVNKHLKKIKEILNE